MKLIVYHGTDYSNAVKISKNKFQYKYNKEHWLGNGAYFFMDYSLAKWWTTKPSKTFGDNIYNPAIMKCSLSTKSDRILNLLKLKDYIEFSNIFDDEFLPMYRETHPLNIPTLKELRCSYCDYLKRQYSLDAIIGNFNVPNQSYLPPKHGNEFDSFLLQYTEVQVCVFNPEIITCVKIERL